MATILCRKQNTNHVRFLQFLHYIKYENVLRAVYRSDFFSFSDILRDVATGNQFCGKIVAKLPTSLGYGKISNCSDITYFTY